MSVQTPIAYPTSPPQEPVSPWVPAPPPPPRRRGLLIGVIAVVVAVIAAVVAVVLTRSSGPPVPAGLHVVSKAATSVVLDWRSGSTKAPDYYVVYRDGSRIATLLGQDSEFTSTGLSPATTYRFQVTAKDGNGESARTPALVVTTEPAPATPAGLHLVKRTSTSITIAWDRMSAPAPESYTVYRDGTLIVTLPGTRLRYTDRALTPGTDFRYQVSASANGLESNPSAGYAASTKVATLADARFGSSYDVRIRITSEGGYTELSPGMSQTNTWWFQTGITGATTLDGNTWSSGGWTMGLHRNGHTWKGRTVEGISSCLGASVDTTVRFIGTVTRAGLSGGSWTVKRFTGQLTQVAPYTVSGGFVCPGAHFAATVSGHLAG